ncbi:MAG TPA: ABC transporter permease subunit [Candidatus Saccharimonadales bacterium]|nr:ABC transporter permease subunit [Candidatus Saccharimonadales bacterium]
MNRVWVIIRRDQADRKVSLIIYCAVILAFITLYSSLYPSIHSQAANLNQLLKSYPKSLASAFNLEDLSFDTLEKYIAAEIFSFSWLILTIILMLSRAANALAGEVERGTMSFLLSQPIKRLQLFAARYLSNLITLLIFTVVSVLGIIPIASAFGNHPMAGRFVELLWPTLMFGWTIMALGMMLSSFFNERSRVYFVAGGMLMIMYVLNIVAGLKDSLKWVGKISVFHYFNPQQVLVHGHQNSALFLVFSLSIGATTSIGAWWFNRRDLSV